MPAMSYPDFPAFVADLERRGELVRVKEPVDPVLEMTEVADRCVKRGGPALLFENPVGSQFPVALNTFASPERTALALGVESVEEIAARIRALVSQIGRAHV